TTYSQPGTKNRESKKICTPGSPKGYGVVASTGIEPVSGASETLILSIVLRGRYLTENPNRCSESLLKLCLFHRCRTCIWSFVPTGGRDYTIHCTTRPVQKKKDKTTSNNLSAA